MRNILFSILIIFITGFYCDVEAQCFKDRHSTNWHDAWTSCEMALSPNTTRPMSHWIMYDLESEHRLDRTHIWNYNDINHLEFGLQEVVIDYSLDGTNWTEAGIYSLTQADGTPTYDGAEGPNLGGITARYILITALSNFGGDCFGMSEIRIEAEEINVAVTDVNVNNSCLTIDVFPNPMQTDARVYVRSECKGEVQYQLINMLGAVVSNGNISASVNQSGYFRLNGSSLNAGEYILEVGNEEGTTRKTIMKL